MNTKQINQIMKSYPNSKNVFLGTFALDEIPIKIMTYPACMIINNQSKNRPGEHWLAIYFDQLKRATFFDSYGFSPEYYKLEYFLKRNSKSFIINKIIFQSYFSKYCGYYCVFFLIFMCKKYSLKKFQLLFKTPIENDKMFKKLISKN